MYSVSAEVWFKGTVTVWADLVPASSEIINVLSVELIVGISNPVVTEMETVQVLSLAPFQTTVHKFVAL